MTLVKLKQQIEFGQADTIKMRYEISFRLFCHCQSSLALSCNGEFELTVSLMPSLI